MLRAGGGAKPLNGVRLGARLPAGVQGLSPWVLGGEAPGGDQNEIFSPGGAVIPKINTPPGTPP